jgi:hypothetical protein
VVEPFLGSARGSPCARLLLSYAFNRHDR